MPDSPLVVLVDGSSYLFRAFHALPPLTNSKGQPTGVVYGVVNMLRRLMREYPDAHIAVVFDAKGPNFRHQAFADYKANRPPMPEELAAQIAPTQELVRALGLPLLVVDGVEADDVIGTLARRAAARGEQVLISTADKDLAQLVDERVRLVNTMTNTVLDVAGVEAKFGVPPRLIADFLALTGDSVDNIPGVPGVGPKTAAKWLRQYGSLDGVIAHAQDIGGKVGENLRAVLDALPLYRQLATVRCEVPLAIDPDNLNRAAPDTDTLKRLFTELEFKSWLRELEQGKPGGQAPAADPPAIDRDGYETVLDPAALERWCERLAAAQAFAFDLETDSLDPITARIVGVSFACEPGQAAYVPVGHDYPGAPDQLPADAVLARLQPLLETGTPRLIGQGFKFDYAVLAEHGCAVAGPAFDTMLESYVLDSTASRHDMDTLAARHLGHTTITFKDVAGSGKNQLTFNQVDIETATRYAAEDADVTLRLHRHFWPQIEAEPTLRRVFETIEMPLLPVLARMERCGVLIDAALLRRQSMELAAAMQRLEAEAYALAGHPFNLGSPLQIQQVLYEEHKLPVLGRTPKGQPSTAEDVLQELALHYPLARVILEHRSLSKLRSTYTDKLPAQVHPVTGRVHTSYQQAVASTGRLSSSDPNLQNIPVRTAEGRRIRQAFIAPDGCKLLSADYSQIELRIMAHLSGDAGLRRAFAEGADVHRATAAEIFGVPPEAVSAEQRRAAKAINFGLIYGMSAFGLAQQLGIDRTAAQRYVDQYFARYPGVRAYMDATREQARERGYVETVFGRRLYLPDIRSSNSQRRQYAERTAINAPMQGTAADLIKLAMIRIDRWLRDNGQPARMILQVHDELVFEVPVDHAEALRGTVAALMTADNPLDVPLEVETGLGANWDQAH
ncbi:DNA polymerase I [Immundisolibacter sp.]|uniref:DNA polymerase I n=1 Tax=Immundisolibacter sp. TaxID=1934948 RepID=UPI0026080A2F|nr:DNA polymerase I [Immundisolibacter sp.]MDD3652372.1 DNA polymerase I [Immundisolibacter sp.]